MEALDQLDRARIESRETRSQLEKKLAEQETEYETRLKLLEAEHDLIVKDVKQSKESTISRLNKQLETQKAENEQAVSELRETLARKEAENAELAARLRECEDALAKDKDERIQRLLDIQRTLEKEIESLKAAIDIKNIDLVQLRTKNNELVTKVENYNELNIKLRRSKQEIEQLNAILKNKQDAERRATEHNRVLTMKIEAKAKENQRLSMQNELLQFRLQSQPNLSGNESSLLMNSSSMAAANSNNLGDEQIITPNKLGEHQGASSPKPKSRTKSALVTKASSATNSTDAAAANELEDELPTMSSLPVKLRSKSFKTTSNTTPAILHSAAEQFRPVSENFDFDEVFILINFFNFTKKNHKKSALNSKN